MSYKNALKQDIASYLKCNKEDVTLSWKGRVSLYGIIKSLELEKGDEIIIPAFTCVVVPNAIIYNDLKPIYVDIEPETYNIDVSKIEAEITSKTKVIMAQNTYGLSSDIDEIKKLAIKYNLYVIEDCTHGFGGSYKNKLNGTHADATFFSTQWNKMFSTAIGGFAIIQNKTLNEKMNQFEQSLLLPTKKDSLMISLQMHLKELLGYKSLYWKAIKFYRFLTKNNLLLGSSSGEELDSVIMPDDYLKGLSDVQIKKAIAEIKKIDRNIEHRQLIADHYNKTLSLLGVDSLFIPSYSSHTYTKYPLLVKDRALFFKDAEKSNVPIQDWFISQIHPIEKDFDKWFLTPDKHPISHKISKHIINLPTDFSVTEKLKLKIGNFLKENKHQILSYKEL